MKEFKLPDLGENIESADVVAVLVKKGDTVVMDQSLIEIETDKATIEVPSTIEGIVADVMIKAGDNVKVGHTIIKIDESTSPTSKIKEEKKNEPAEVEEKSLKAEVESKPKTETKPKTPAGKKEVVDFILPDLGENIEAADVISVLVKSGDTIEKDQSVIEIETDKATIEVPSTVAGKVVEVLIKEGEKAKVGQVILKIEITEAEKIVSQKISEPKEQAGIQNAEPLPASDTKEKAPDDGTRDKHEPGEIDDQLPITKGAAPAAPSVRRIARELVVDINKVPGTSANGRISMDDVKAYVKKLNEVHGDDLNAGTNLTGVKQEKLPDFNRFGEVERKAMSNIRSKTADHLSYAWAAIPHVTQFDKADITELEKMRKSFNPSVEKAGGKLTVTSILIKVLTSALKVFPQFNSSIDMEKKEIVFKKYFNIGIAVDTEHGLIVPVLKDVDKKNLTQLSVEMNLIAEKARARKIGLDDLQGGCITITNLGGIGGTSFTPIVNSPEVAILGVSRGSFEPVYNKETKTFEPRLMLPLSLSYDHRIIDGADAARFLRWVCEALEQPLKLLVEG